MQPSLFSSAENILPFDGEVYYYQDFFSQEVADRFFAQLKNEINWQQEAIKIFGKKVMQPRLTAWYGDEGKSYSYSGITMQPNKWTEPLLLIKQQVETVAPVCFNSALLNYYRHQKDSMGWHRDNEKELGIHPVIASVSLGAARKFQLRRYQKKDIIKSIELIHGSLLLMQGATQHYWEHQLPKTTRQTGERINITFRVII